jgi:hypothetical protein
METMMLKMPRNINLRNAIKMTINAKDTIGMKVKGLTKISVTQQYTMMNWIIRSDFIQTEIGTNGNYPTTQMMISTGNFKKRGILIWNY